jgi:hypothetical protein
LLSHPVCGGRWQGWRCPLVGRNCFIAPIGRASPHAFEFKRKRLRREAQ